MSINRIDAEALQKAFLAAAAGLDSQQEWINELNVFPVPDGDTGTNMTLTISAAASEVRKLSNPDMPQLCRTISSGALRGARGNSGVILSQLLRGFCREVAEYKDIDTVVLASALGKATDTAYKAVMKPKEGTILTVAKAMSEAAMKQVYEEDDLETFIEKVIAEGDEALASTPDLLPVLKQAGVVDSGGQGLMVIVKSAFDYLRGKNTDIPLFADKGSSGASASSPKAMSIAEIDTADIKFGYCTEFIINAQFNESQEEAFKKYLETKGDSIVCVVDDNLVKIHVHTNDPGEVISHGLKFGELSRLKIDNLREEHEELYQKEMRNKNSAEPRKKYGIISVSAGKGLSDIFKGLGTDCIIEGGQTMNPSTEDILDAVNRVNADNVLILPNNKNIILAAKQAALLCEDKKVFVIETKTIPQGITALITFSEDDSPEDNVGNISEAISSYKSAEVTYSIRDTSIDGFEIKAKDIMFIGDNGILAVDNKLEEAMAKGLERLVNDESELVTLYYGAEIKEEDARALADRLKEKFDKVDIEVEFGGQPVYYYLVSVE